MALRITLLDTRQHDRAGFVCSVEALDDYLRQRAGQHQRDGIATIHVLIDDENPSQILGYCALSAAQLYLHELNEADRKRLPAWPVPAMRMGRLAIAATEQGKGYGRLLLGHAVNLAFSPPDNGCARDDCRCQRHLRRRVLPRLRFSPDGKRRIDVVFAGLND